jgi:nucleoid DNA-binding protein
MRATATVTLTAHSRLRSPTRLQAHAALTVAARSRLRRPQPLRATATLTLTAAAIAPRGLNAQWKVTRDRLTRAVLQQSLQVWVHTTPPGLHVALRVDDGPPVEQPFTWENPRSGPPAVLRISEAELPQDGFTHYLTVSAWRDTNGIHSAPAAYTFKAQLAAPPVPIPEWVSARLIRQNSTELPDLVEITWRARTAVVVIAHLRKTGARPFNARLGVADRDETRLLAEGVGVLFEYPDNQRYPVYFGVAGLRHGQESPIRWWDTPLMIQASDGQPTAAPPSTPDTRAGTAVTLVAPILPGYTHAFSLAIRANVLAALGTLPTHGDTIIDQAVYRLFRKIKDVLRQGGTVTLDHLGTFGTSWTSARTTRNSVTGVETAIPAYRQPTFTASIGYKVGTRAGTLLTDAEAKPS